MTCLVVAKCCDDDYVTLDELVTELDNPQAFGEAYADASAYAFSVLGRNLTSDDFNSIVSATLVN